MSKFKYIILTCFITTKVGLAQFAPAAGSIGSSAIHKDSSIFIAWATSCQIQRGLQDIAIANSTFASVGDSSSAIDLAGLNGVVSLGDGGVAILQFQKPIVNGFGFDFAVFENSFSDNFLELAFVEVSSDGINYFRFPAVCNVQDTSQIGPFDYTDPTLINNLAGKYRINYGTPFDLQELSGIAGLDVNNITHVKVIDVIGTIDENYASYDVNGHKINEPYPTPFASGGFDLDAVGIINQSNSINIKTKEFEKQFSISIANKLLYVNATYNKNYTLTLSSVEGKNITTAVFQNKTQIATNNLSSGIYFVSIQTENDVLTKKIIITND